jgi:hypothetical protein
LSEKVVHLSKTKILQAREDRGQES